MTQYKHTPAPWKVIFKHGPSGSTDYYNIMGTDGKKIAEIKDTGDARLIAAAPEMLDALIIAHNMLVELEVEKDAHEHSPAAICMRQIKTAIAKATGET